MEAQLIDTRPQPKFDLDELRQFSTAQRGEKFIGLNSLTDAVKVEIIIMEVLCFYSLTWEEIMIRSRKMELVRARQVISYFIRTKTAMGLGKIGRIFGNDHSTIIHSIDTIKDLMQYDAGVRGNVLEMEKRIDFNINLK